MAAETAQPKEGATAIWGTSMSGNKHRGILLFRGKGWSVFSPTTLIIL